jgi:uncharacterized protein YigE (DUF2233 family)
MRLFAALTLALLAGCGAASEQAPEQPAFEPETVTARPYCEPRNFEGTPFTICRFDASQQELRLVVDSPASPPLRSFAALETSLGPDADRVLFAMNAGMYDEVGRPIGLFIADGEERKPVNLRSGSGNFHLLPNGVFAVDAEGRVSVTAADKFKRRVPAPRLATQSGPMLVIDGKLHPKFDEDGESRLVRNGVGMRDGKTAYFAISEEGVSFGRFARLFRDALGCPNALYLDGTVSSLWDPGAGRQDAYDQLGPLLVVLSRPSSSAR